MNKTNLSYLLLKIERVVGKISSMERVNSVTNDVYILSGISKKYVLKLINKDKRIGEDIDAVLLKKSKNTYFRKLLMSFQAKDGKQVLLLEYLKGQILANIYEDKSSLPSNLFFQFKDFFNKTALVESEGYGVVSFNLKASSSSWESFIREKLNIYLNVLGIYPDLRDNILFLTKFSSNLALEYPVLVPADVNLTNFLITKKNELRVLDVGVYISGDKFLPYGLLLAHVWNSDLEKDILKHFSKNDTLLHFYACIEMLAILAFTKKNYPENYDFVKPFGQEAKAIDILHGNLKRIIK